MLALLICIVLLAPSLRDRLNHVTFAAAPQYEQLYQQDGALPAAPAEPPSAEIMHDEQFDLAQMPLLVMPESTPTMEPEYDIVLDGAFVDRNGVMPEGITVFNDQYPGITKLNPVLLAALREAANSASDSGVDFYVTSGWRSPAYQEQLLREAIIEYGSQEEALRWVATADRSSHVSGDAVDIGQYNAMDWLAQHGAEYGLCQIYANEPWHYELRPAAREQGCPQMYIDPSEDPRMQP